MKTPTIVYDTNNIARGVFQGQYDKNYLLDWDGEKFPEPSKYVMKKRKHAEAKPIENIKIKRGRPASGKHKWDGVKKFLNGYK